MLALWATGSSLGCATLPNGRGWGQDATLLPGWHHIWQTARTAALEPQTWAPLAGALVFKTSGLDRRLASWSSTHTPLFGSPENADTASDYLVSGALAAYLTSALATPSGEDPAQWVPAKSKGIAVGIGAIGFTHLATDLLKSNTHRRRPDGSSERSFPSAHASAAAVNLALASRNLDSLPLSGKSRVALQACLIGATVGTAWARLEANKHYPSDVLVGAALGHFLGAFFNDAFLGLNLPHDPRMTVEPQEGGLTLHLSLSF